MAVYGYIRHSLEKQELSAETQQFGITEYARRTGLEVTSWAIDSAQYSKKLLWDRPAGKELCQRLRKGDIVIVLRIDRLGRSIPQFVRVLELWQKIGVIIHITDFAGGVFDPENPMSRLMVHVLMSFADYQHSLIVQTTKEGLATVRREGRRSGFTAPYGWKFERRYNPRARTADGLGKYQDYVVPNHEERAIMAKMVELRSLGYSLWQVCNYLNEEWGVRNRKGNKWIIQRIKPCMQAYMKLMAEQAQAQEFLTGIDVTGLLPEDAEDDFEEPDSTFEREERS